MKKLSMKFVTTNDDITTLTINEVREDITDEQVNSLTSLIVTVGSEEHTSELQSRGLISYAVFCLKKKKINIASTAETHS